MMHFKKALTAIAVSFLLSACGSDDVGGDDAITPDFSFSNISLQTEFELDELTSGTVTVTTDYTGNKQLTYSIGEFNSSVAGVEITDNVITINAADQTEREYKTAWLTVSVTDGSTVKSEKTLIIIKNTSYVDIIEQINEDYALGTDILSQNHESAVFTWAVDMAYLNGGSGFDQRNFLKEIYEERVTLGRENLQSVLTDVHEKLIDAPVNEVEETNVTEISAVFDEAIAFYIQQVAKTFDVVNQVTVEGVPEIKLDGLSHVNGVASFFYGNRHMGSYGKDNKWVFVKPYEKFEKIIPLNQDICRVSDAGSEE